MLPQLSIPNDKLPSECKNSLFCILQITPPMWLKEELKLIRTKKEILIENKEKENSIMTMEEFKEILEKSGLTKKNFANKLGISRQMVSGIYNGKKKITKKISNIIRVKFENLFTHKKG